jgi:16S rRNA (cytidine1402-2'-O)-methyltransferase
VVREATKLHEEILEGTLAEMAARFREDVRGEFVLVVEGAAPGLEDPRVPVEALLQWAEKLGLSADRAAREVAILTGLARNDLVRRARAGRRRPD